MKGEMTMKGGMWVCAALAAVLSAGAVETDPQTLKVSSMSPQMFLAQRSKSPVVFRAKISICPEYQNPGSPLAKDAWIVNVSAYSKSNRETKFYGFVPHASTLGPKIAKYLEDGESHYALVQMRYPEKGGGSRECLIVNFASAQLRNGIITADGAAADGADVEPEESEAKPTVTFSLENTRFSVVQGKNDDAVDGHPVLIARSNNKRIRRPVVRLLFLTEEDGMFYCTRAVLVEPKTYDGATRTEVPEHSGVSPYDPAGVSRIQPEVVRSNFARVTYGGFDANKTVVRRFLWVPKKARLKLLNYRIEVWHNGTCVKSYEYDQNAAKRASLPEDWYEHEKYPGQIRYRTRYGGGLSLSRKVAETVD